MAVVVNKSVTGNVTKGGMHVDVAGRDDPPPQGIGKELNHPPNPDIGEGTRNAYSLEVIIFKLNRLLQVVVYEGVSVCGMTARTWETINM
jgi:hypothetical protein